MTPKQLERVNKGAFLVTQFVARGIVSFIAEGDETVDVMYLHDHCGHKRGDIGRYFVKELTTLETFGNPCMDGEGHVSHDFSGDFCCKCELSEKAIEFLRKIRKEGKPS